MCEVASSIRLQAEFASYGGSATVGSSNLEFAGNGYVNLTANGAYIQWNNVNGLNGGGRTIRFRYANGNGTSPTVSLTVNGVAQNISFPPTGSSTTYQLVNLPVSLNSGTNNTIQLLDTTGQNSGNIDELQIL